MQKGERDAAIGVLLPVPGFHRHPGPGGLVGRVLVGEEGADLVLEPQLVPRPLIVPVDRDDRERLAGVLGVGEDGELVAAPELQIDRLVLVVRALDLHGADVVQRRLGLGVLHHAVDVVRLVDLGKQGISKAIANDSPLRAWIVGVFAESIHGLLNKSRLTTRTAGEIKLSLSFAPRLIAVALQVVERLVLDGGCEPRPVVAQPGLDLLYNPTRSSEENDPPTFGRAGNKRGSVSATADYLSCRP